MKKLFIAIGLAAGFSGSQQAKAQDPHLSQYYASPLYLNPAMTGMVSGAYRVNANYKSQWGSITKGYKTMQASFDAPLANKLGVGGYVIHQAAGDGGFKNTNVMASASYHINFGQDGAYFLSFGLQGGITNKTFDINNLYFDEQYLAGIGYDPGRPSGENFSDNNSFNADFNAGIFLFDGDPDKNANPFLGYSAFHLLRPKETLFSSDYNLPVRHLVHGGVKVRLNTNFDLTPHALFQRQKEAQELAAGLYGEYHFPFNNTHLLFGAAYRAVNRADLSAGTNAVIPYLGFQVQDLLIGLSYDVAASGLSDAVSNRGGLELSISFSPPGVSKVPKFFCPRL